MHPHPCHWEKYMHISNIGVNIQHKVKVLVNQQNSFNAFLFSLKATHFIQTEWFNISGSNWPRITQSNSLGFHYFVGNCYFGRKVLVWCLPLPPEHSGFPSERGWLRSALGPLGFCWRSPLPLISFPGHAPMYCYIRFFPRLYLQI